MPIQDEYDQAHLQRNKLRINQQLSQIYVETNHGGFSHGFSSRFHKGGGGGVTVGAARCGLSVPMFWGR